MKKLSLVFGLAFICSCAFAQTTGTPKTGSVQLTKPGTTTVKTPTSTVTPAPAPTTAPSSTVNTPTPTTSVEKEYPEGQEKQTSPTAPKTTKRPLVVKKIQGNKPGTVKSQKIEK